MRRRHQGSQGGSRKDGQAKTEQQHQYFLNLFFPPNKHGKATKPPQKHTFHLHSDPTPQLCTCCSHLHSKVKFTLARSPKLQHPGGPPEKGGRMRNAPLTASLSLSRSSWGSPQALPVAGHQHHAALAGCGTMSAHRSTCATTQSSEIQKTTTHGGGEASKLQARPNSLLCRRARASSNATPPGQLSL